MNNFIFSVSRNFWYFGWIDWIFPFRAHAKKICKDIWRNICYLYVITRFCCCTEGEREKLCNGDQCWMLMIRERKLRKTKIKANANKLEIIFNSFISRQNEQSFTFTASQHNKIKVLINQIWFYFISFVRWIHARW